MENTHPVPGKSRTPSVPPMASTPGRRPWLRLPAALVFDLDEDAIGGRRRSHHHVAVGTAEVEGILEQDANGSREERVIDLDVDTFGDGRDGQLEAFRPGSQRGRDPAFSMRADTATR